MCHVQQYNEAGRQGIGSQQVQSISAEYEGVADLLKGQCLHVYVIRSTLRAGISDQHRGRLLAGVRVAAPLLQKHYCQCRAQSQLWSAGCSIGAALANDSNTHAPLHFNTEGKNSWKSPQTVLHCFDIGSQSTLRIHLLVQLCKIGSMSTALLHSRRAKLFC